MGSRLYAVRAQTYPTSATATHQAVATMALWPIGVPSSSPRIVSIIEVKGWYSANHRTPTGMVSGGTKPLLIMGPNWRRSVELLAPATDLAAIPIASASHVRARVKSATKPARSCHLIGPAGG